MRPFIYSFIGSLCLLANVAYSADSCEPIRAALRALPAQGGEVRVASGEHVCEAPIILDHNDTALVGENGAVLRLADNANSPLLVMGKVGASPSRTQNLRVANLVLEGNKENQQHECWGGACDAGGRSYIRNNAITVRAVEGGMIQNVEANHARAGGLVTEKGTIRLFVDGLRADGNYIDGFQAHETTDSLFRAMELVGNQAAGMSADMGFDGNLVRDVALANNGDVGLFLRDSDDNLFSDIRIDRSGSHGIFLSYVNSMSSCANDNQFRDLTVSRSQGAGFRLENPCTGNILTGRTRFSGNRIGCISAENESLLPTLGSLACE